MSGSASGFVDEPEDYTTFLGPLARRGPHGFLLRLMLAYSVPTALLLSVAFIPDLADLLIPNDTVQLGSAFAVSWLLMSMGLVGAILGFLWPRTGAFQAVLVGGLVVVTQSVLSWAKADASRDSLQLALYTWMVWVSICLIGAWVGLLLRQISNFYLHRVRENRPEDRPALAVETGPE